MSHAKSIITDEIFESYLNCKYKAHLKLHNQASRKTDYEISQDRLDCKFRTIAKAKFQAHFQGRQALRIPYLNRTTLQKASTIIVDAFAEHDGLACSFDALSPSAQNRTIFEPYLYLRFRRIAAVHKLILAFKALVIGRLQGTIPVQGYIIYDEKCSIKKIRLETYITKANRILHELHRQIITADDPPLFLNCHCDICEFYTFCKAKATEVDSLSLLRGISIKQIQKYNQKGIFTVEQLSYTFRSRRPSKRKRHAPQPHNFALQALSIRKKTIHIHGSPELPTAKTSVYFDIEGIPERRFNYLIGVVVVEGGKKTHRVFWADHYTDQETIFSSFLKYVDQLSDCRLFHFGSYDTTALKQMRRRLSKRLRPVLDSTLARCVNVLSVVHSHIYFPTYSNGLKDISHALGCTWSEPDASGIHSMLWRTKWEKDHNPALKAKLIQYNKEDNLALIAVCNFIRRLTFPVNSDEPGDANRGVVNTSELARVPPENRHVFRQVEFVLGDLQQVNKCAYFDYQRERIFVRTNKDFKEINRRRRNTTRSAYRPNIYLEPHCRKCPTCKSKNISQVSATGSHIIDLKFFRNGVKRWVTRYAVRLYRCLDCDNSFHSPRIPDRRSRYSAGLQTWCVYMHVARRHPMSQVRHILRDLFGLRVDKSVIFRFKRSMARYYRPTYKRILNAILDGPVLHIDETTAPLTSRTGYVWVLTSMKEVYYLYKDSRAGQFLKKMLTRFSGVLISDFYTAYDAIDCPQQKCLVHLIRDMNDDLLRNPFDEEFKNLAKEFAVLLRRIVATVDRYGLKRWHLQKHKKPARKFLNTVRSQIFSSGAAQKYQKRFKKSGAKLFTFLDYDGVPWNNNNAEHAIKAFAKHRRLAAGRSTEGSIREYLILLSVVQTCEYKNIDVLKFLLSRQRKMESECCVSH